MRRNPKFICWVLLASCATGHTVERPKTNHLPRLPDGHVDMQGNWTISNLTPLERPEGITRLSITAADAARLQAEYLVPAGGPNQPDDPGLDRNRSFEPIRGQLRSSLIIDPNDGKIPWRDGYREKSAALRRSVLNAFDNPEERPPLERCVGSTGSPPMQPMGDNNEYLFVQTPTTTAIVSETIHDARIIRMNETHSPAALTSWLGDSIGWWEHDTLVVETKYFSSSSSVRLTRRHVFLVSPQTTVIERFTRVSDNELNYVFTVTDPTYYTRSWTGETHLLRSQHSMFEYACHEGNYSMRNILEAARANDPKATSAIAPTSTKH
jgi:hypothetical protein